MVRASFGQTLAQLVQPMQSSGLMAIANLRPVFLGIFTSSVRMVSGPAATSSSVMPNGRMVACGQT